MTLKGLRRGRPALSRSERAVRGGRGSRRPACLSAARRDTLGSGPATKEQPVASDSRSREPGAVSNSGGKRGGKTLAGAAETRLRGPREPAAQGGREGTPAADPRCDDRPRVNAEKRPVTAPRGGPAAVSALGQHDRPTRARNKTGDGDLHPRLRHPGVAAASARVGRSLRQPQSLQVTLSLNNWLNSLKIRAVTTSK